MALAESGDWSTPANNLVKDAIGEPAYTLLKNGFCIAGSVLFGGPVILRDNSNFTRASPQEVINKSQEIGHNLRSSGANDQGLAGQYNDSHAEKQLFII